MPAALFDASVVLLLWADTGEGFLQGIIVKLLCPPIESCHWKKHLPGPSSETSLSPHWTLSLKEAPSWAPPVKLLCPPAALVTRRSTFLAPPVKLLCRPIGIVTGGSTFRTPPVKLLCPSIGPCHWKKHLSGPSSEASLSPPPGFSLEPSFLGRNSDSLLPPQHQGPPASPAALGLLPHFTFHILFHTNRSSAGL